MQLQVHFFLSFFAVILPINLFNEVFIIDAIFFYSQIYMLFFFYLFIYFVYLDFLEAGE